MMVNTNADDLQAIIDALPQMFFHKDTKNNILRVNKAGADAVGTTVAELVGTPTTQWFPDEAGDYYRDDLAVMESGVPHIGIKEQFQMDGGDKHWISTDKFPHFDESNNVDGILVFIRDVTAESIAEAERQELEAQIRHAQKLEGIGVLAAGVAHDFNNYLMSIVGNAELALTYNSELTDTGKHLDTILQSALQASEVCNQLLTYAGRKNFDLKPCYLSDIVSDIRELLEIPLTNTIDLILNPVHSVLPILVDPNQIKQLLINLVTNAAEAIGDQSGQIIITTGERHYDEDTLPRVLSGDNLVPGNYCFINVKDSGTGMSEATIDQIFQPFFTTKSSGRGLGLATVLGTIRSHQGAITVTSEPSVGTMIELLLPTTDVEVDTQPTDNGGSETTQPISTILVVDDDETVRLLLQTMLERAGHTVIPAIDGESAIEEFRNSCDNIDAVVLDFSMPGLNGLEVFNIINQQKPGVPVLFSSGYPEEIAIENLKSDGQIDFIKKPYKSSDLLAKVSVLLG